jgi:hypothetical protein
VNGKRGKGKKSYVKDKTGAEKKKRKRKCTADSVNDNLKLKDVIKEEVSEDEDLWAPESDDDAVQCS